MNYDDYVSLVKKFELDAENNPRSYRFKAKFFALLGYSYFGFLILTPLFVIVFFVAAIFSGAGSIGLILGVLGKLFLFVLAFGIAAMGAFWSALKSLFTEVEPPTGIELTKENSPELFEKVGEICKNLKAPRPSRILLNPSVNASISNFPRWGIFGNITFLSIGLPLLEALSVKQFNSVLAHEVGHISNKDGSRSSWVYQLRETWGRFLASQEAEGSKMSFLYESFVNWYFPYFNAYSFVLARLQERAADKMAIEMFGARPLAEALINLELKSRFIDEKFWRKLFQLAKDDANPPSEVFSKMFVELREKKLDADDSVNFQNALKVRTNYEDTHPCLKERLETMGFEQLSLGEMVSTLSIENTASTYYLGSRSEDFRKVFDSEWQAEIADAWEKEHKLYQETKKRLGELETKKETEPLSDDECYEIANLIATINESDAARPHLMEILDRNPKYANAKYALGCILLEQDEDEGIKLLKESMELDGTLSLNVCNALYAYYFMKNRDEEAAEYAKKYDQFALKFNEADAERKKIWNTDSMEIHKLEPEIVEKAIKLCESHEEIESAYLVRKVMVHFPEQPCNILAIQTRKNWFAQKADDEIILNLLGNKIGELGISYVILLSSFRDLHKRIDLLPNAKIYVKPQKR